MTVGCLMGLPHHLLLWRACVNCSVAQAACLIADEVLRPSTTESCWTHDAHDPASGKNLEYRLCTAALPGKDENGGWLPTMCIQRQWAQGSRQTTQPSSSTAFVMEVLDFAEEGCN